LLKFNETMMHAARLIDIFDIAKPMFSSLLKLSFGLLGWKKFTSFQQRSSVW